jgi:peptidoglycan/xylan/chitin deacetylase (PgdA/CDA1 family)
VRRANASLGLVLAIAALAIAPAVSGRSSPQQASRVPSTTPANGMASILVYHRFGPVVADSMTIRTATFASELEYLKSHHYVVLPLRTIVNHFVAGGPPPPEHSVFITVDDGHKSVFTDMLPLVRQYRLPVTLFIYPSAISNASYAMTWDQLRTLRDTGLFDIQSHTYWHPNFHIEKKRLAPDAYRDFATKQLCKSRDVLQAKLGLPRAPDLVAWPFGIHDEELARLAQGCGYVAGFTLGGHLVGPTDQAMSLPRFLMTDAASGPHFAPLLPPATSR